MWHRHTIITKWPPFCSNLSAYHLIPILCHYLTSCKSGDVDFICLPRCHHNILDDECDVAILSSSMSLVTWSPNWAEHPVWTSTCCICYTFSGVLNANIHLKICHDRDGLFVVFTLQALNSHWVLFYAAVSNFPAIMAVWDWSGPLTAWCCHPL